MKQAHVLAPDAVDSPIPEPPQNEVAGFQQALQEQTVRLAEVATRLDAMLKREDDLHEAIRALRDQLWYRDDALQATLYDLELAGTAQEGSPGLSKAQAYHQLVRRIREEVRGNLPREAHVLVVSKGDSGLLDLYGRISSHFPQRTDGTYAGYYPKTSSGAIAHLEVLRAKGAGYLLLPSPALWWLDHYAEFRRHLVNRYSTVVRHEDTCVIFDLREPKQSADTGLWAQLQSLIAEHRQMFDRDPAILNWDSGVDLTEAVPSNAIFSPPTLSETLPYLDQSIDVVVVGAFHPDRTAEAHRVAQAAVVSVTPGPIGTHHGKSTDVLGDGQVATVEWKVKTQRMSQLTTSIIIPTYNGWAYTESCLTTLRETLPGDFQGEIIVVDDASTDDTGVRLRQIASEDPRLTIVENSMNEGFLASTNRGASVASGEVLIFLNNDTILLPGWLSPLLQTFHEHADAGAVGGKLLYPDGRLQEAGGVVFSDGSAAKLGYGDQDAEAPLYSYLREVDYCSGALLATKRDLFHKLGGFDPRYRFGYYEDTDYCFRVREQGLRVYYQPDSVIVHVEGGTAGTDICRGPKRFQHVNRDIFAERWHDALKNQPAPLDPYDSLAKYRLAVPGGSRRSGEAE